MFLNIVWNNFYLYSASRLLRDSYYFILIRRYDNDLIDTLFAYVIFTIITQELLKMNLQSTHKSKIEKIFENIIIFVNILNLLLCLVTIEAMCFSIQYNSLLIISNPTPPGDRNLIADQPGKTGGLKHIMEYNN